MSARSIVYLYCDGGDECPRMDEGNIPFSSDATPGETAAMQRKYAKREGWIYRNGKDYCAECVSRLWPKRRTP